MARQDGSDGLGPGRVPRSRTGRVPQWVVDEALGRPVQPVPFRAATTPARGPRARRWGSRAVTVLLVGALAAGGWWVKDPLGRRSGSALLLAGGGTERQSPPAGHEETGVRPVRHAGLSEGQGFRFLAHQADGRSPVGWSPCRPVHYVVRPDHAPPDGAQLLTEAVAAVGAATGLRFVDDGPTDEGPLEDRAPYQRRHYGDRWAPVLVTWATADEVPDFGIDVAGEAGPATLTTPSGDEAFVSGTVALDPESITRIEATAGREAARSVVLHELGHLVGLAHVNDVGQIMFPRTGKSVAYAAGDLAGLSALGGTACQPDA